MRCVFENGSHSGFPVIYVRGDFDSAAILEFEGLIGTPGDGRSSCLIVDLLDVAYSEAGSLRAVLLAQRKLAEDGKSLAVVCCAPLIHKLVELATVDEQIRVFHSLEGAAEYLSVRC